MASLVEINSCSEYAQETIFARTSQIMQFCHGVSFVVMSVLEIVMQRSGVGGRGDVQEARHSDADTSRAVSGTGLFSSSSPPQLRLLAQPAQTFVRISLWLDSSRRCVSPMAADQQDRSLLIEGLYVP